jgi:hypothetical protein
LGIGNQEARWGTGDIGFSDVNSGFPLRENQSRGACCLREAASPVRESKAGFEPAFPSAKYPKSSPPALVEPQDAANQTTN